MKSKSKNSAIIRGTSVINVNQLSSLMGIIYMLLSLLKPDSYTEVVVKHA
jgi:hypothetical protein